MKCTDCSTELLPIVCVDIDGTLGEYHGQFVSFASEYFGRKLQTGWNGYGEWEDFLGLTKAEYRDAKLAYRQGGMKRTMPLRAGAKDMMVALGEMGVEIWLTTTRPWMRLDSVDPDTREWLRRNDIPYHHLLYDEDKYYRLADIVDSSRVIAVLDDLTEQCDLADSAFGGRGVAYQCINTHNIWFPYRQRIAIGDFHRVVRREVGRWLAR